MRGGEWVMEWMRMWGLDHRICIGGRGVYRFGGEMAFLRRLDGWYKS